jgi:hypothetical protein
LMPSLIFALFIFANLKFWGAGFSSSTPKSFPISHWFFEAVFREVSEAERWAGYRRTAHLALIFLSSYMGFLILMKEKINNTTKYSNTTNIYPKVKPTTAFIFKIYLGQYFFPFFNACLFCCHGGYF